MRECCGFEYGRAVLKNFGVDVIRQKVIKGSFGGNAKRNSIFQKTGREKTIADRESGVYARGGVCKWEISNVIRATRIVARPPGVSGFNPLESKLRHR